MARAPLNRNGDHLHADISDDRRSPRQRVDDAVETGRIRRKKAQNVFVWHSCQSD